MPSALIIGSGAGGSVSAWALASAGWDVIVFEKGTNCFPGLGSAAGVREPPWANDEIKMTRRGFAEQDPFLEPRAFRTQDEAASGVERSFVGDVNGLPTTVGGGTVHWGAGYAIRFWRQDFKALSLYGPIDGASIADWPLSYDELAPYYSAVERQLGVQGDLASMPASTLAQAPRTERFPMTPGPQMYSSRLASEGARKLGYQPYRAPMALNSRPYGGRSACVNCGFCTSYGCPISAFGNAALCFLHPALRTGRVQLRTETFVYQIDTTPDGRRAQGVRYIDSSGLRRRQTADVVILAASAIETARLALLSTSTAHPGGLGNGSDQIGRNLTFHTSTYAWGNFEQRLHAYRGPSQDTAMDDFVGPVFAPEARSAGLPYIKGGLLEMAPTIPVMQEAGLYPTRGLSHKQLMRQSPFRDRFFAVTLVGEDLPQANNRVDLDPGVRDVHGLPVPRVTMSPHRFEQVASAYFGPRMQAICEAAGARASGFASEATLGKAGLGIGGTAHVMGTMRMGADPRTSVVDSWARMHELDNVHVADGSVFVTSTGFNPTLTIMALALRMAEHLAGASPWRPPTPAPDSRHHRPGNHPAHHHHHGHRDQRRTIPGGGVPAAGGGPEGSGGAGPPVAPGGAAGAGGHLPFTGFVAAITGGIGAAAAATGALLRRATRRRDG